MLRAYCVPCPWAVMYIHPTVGADTNGEGISDFPHSRVGGEGGQAWWKPLPDTRNGVCQALSILGVRDAWLVPLSGPRARRCPSGLPSFCLHKMG